MIVKLQGKIKYFSNKSKSKLKQTFLQIEKWDADSLWILANSMEIYKIDDLEGMVNSIFHGFVDFKKYDDEIIKLLATIAVNYLQICSVHKNLEQEAEKAVNYLDRLPCITSIILEKVNGKFFEAVQDGDYFTAKEILYFLKVNS